MGTQPGQVGTQKMTIDEWLLTNEGIASGFAFGYDPTGRSVFSIKIDRIAKIFNPAMA